MSNFFIAHANEGSCPALKSPIHVLHKFSVHSIFRLSSNFIVFLSGISQPCIQTYSFLRVCSFTCSKHNSFIILAACARQLQKIKQGRNRGLGAVHKVRQHFSGRGEWSKIDEKLMMDRYKKVLTWGRGLSKIAKKC